MHWEDIFLEKNAAVLHQEEMDQICYQDTETLKYYQCMDWEVQSRQGKASLDS